MRKHLFHLLLLTSTTASAYDYPYLTIQRSDGTTQPLAVESIQLAFSEGQLVASTGGKTYTFALTELSKMYFTKTGNDDASQPATLTGDVDQDGSVTQADIVALSEYMAGNTGSIALTSADVNGDGLVNIADIIAVGNIISQKSNQ